MSDLKDIDLIWISLSTALILFMQGGFLLLETGLVRSKNSINVAIKNLFDLCISVSIFWIFGFGLMFGDSVYGLWGKGYFSFQPTGNSPGEAAGLVGFFLFQSTFCATSVTIISGAIAERVYFHSYIIIAVIVSILIYPLFGHWVWGGLLGEGKGWLEQLGFVDFAGSTVVHSMGGWIALAVLSIIGSREGRFSKDNKTHELGFNSIPLASMGGLILWLGWFGFNGGSLYKFSGEVVGILAVTNIAAVFSLLSSHLTSKYLFKRNDPRDMLSGMLSGLVAITACCHVVSIRSAALIGFFAGSFMALSKYFLAKKRIDDAVDAIPVHLVGGVWGTLCVALFGEKIRIGTGLSFGDQLFVQTLGILTCAFWAFVIPYGIFSLINRFFRFRISLDEERKGLNISEHNVSTELYDLYRVLDEDLAEEKQESMTEIGKLAQGYREKTKALKNFLTLTRQGFFSFGSSMKIEVGYSRECHKILVQENLEGKNPAEVLFEAGVKRDDFSGSFGLYFEGKIEIDTLLDLLDRKIVIQKKPDDVKEVSVEYQEIEGNRIMCILTDESDKKELSEKLVSEQEVQDRLVKVVVNSKYFGHLLNEAEELFSLFKEIVAVGKVEASDVESFNAILLDVHDLKANLALFGLEKTTKFAFDLEDFLSNITVKEDIDLERFKALTEKVQESFVEELKFFKEKLGEEWMQNFDSLSIPISNIIEITEAIQKKYPNDDHLLQSVVDLRKVPASEIFHRFADISEKVAERLGKKLRPITIDGGETRLLVDLFGPLTNKLVHIIRNMVDHGIELPEERSLKGKDEYGNIQIKIEEKQTKDETCCLLSFSDDGRGIDFEKLKQAAHDRGILTQNSDVSKSELLKLLFSHNISTASEVSDISGRGVGLASVRQEVKRLNGNISIQTKKNQGTTFLIKIPTSG